MNRRSSTCSFRRVRIFTTALACCLAFSAGTLSASVQESDLANVVAGNNRFAFDLFQRLSGEADGNLFVSPYSISSALAMTYAGARGQTETEMANVLHFDLPQSQLHHSMGELVGVLNNTSQDDYELNVANRLWGQEGFRFHQPFLNTTRDDYGAELVKLDFANHADPSRKTINDWVADQTNQRILNLLPDGSVNPSTKLVLTNAIYFNAEWQHPFDEVWTRPADFRVSDGVSRSVPMMHQTERFRYAETPEAQLLELPYEGDDLSMLILLPNETNGLAEMENWLDEATLADAIDQLAFNEVAVALPKFGMGGSFGLGGTLEDMGMPAAFSDQADFSGMADEALKISQVVHKTFLEVDEGGTEAAAATAVIMSYITAAFFPPTPPKIFNADHPFLLLIRDNRTDSILFMGHVVEPEASQGSFAIPEPSTWTLGALLMTVFGFYVNQKKRLRFSRS